MKVLKINRIEKGDLVFYEALFISGNLYAFTINEIIKQLREIHGFSSSIFEFKLN